jgi:tetratricopeptide (TPR) repeat protein
VWKAIMRILALLFLAAVLGGCASTPLPPPPATLFDDALFDPPTQALDGDRIFALTEPMRRYLKTDIVPKVRSRGPQRALLDALYTEGQLRLQYDATRTRNAAEAFDARAGNCLSLLIMTAAFAKEMGLRVEFHSAIVDETWTRSGNMLLASGHVNVTLGRRAVDVGNTYNADELTVDFLPAAQASGMRSAIISEDTVVSMYMSNRAAESLIDGRLADAYAWAREAILRSPDFFSAYNTLGVVYLRSGHLDRAVAVFEHVLQHEPKNTRAIANLANALAMQGKLDEAGRWQQRLAVLDPHPPFHFFNLGMLAVRQNDYRTARELFAKEVARAEYHSEFHFWLGLASFKLGDVDEARRHLKHAVENSQTGRDRDTYSAKLAWLQALGRR